MKILNIILAISAVFLFAGHIRHLLRQVRKKENSFAKVKRLTPLTLGFLLIAIPFVLVNWGVIPQSIRIGNGLDLVISVSAALFISVIWLIYIRNLDVFDRDSWVRLGFTFILSCIAINSVWYTRYLYIGLSGNVLGEGVIGDFMFSFLAIGGTEELAKLIPLILIAKFTKWITEPYDYILYASASALGFAFVENIQYIGSFEIQVANARALYATVAHMTFSTIIAYGMILFKYRLGKNRWIGAFIFFFIASLAHGFYDFWLISDWAKSYSFITTLFFLASVHLWVIMKINSINLSPFFNPEIEVRNDKLKSHLSLSLIAVFMFAYVMIAIKYDNVTANEYMTFGAISYAYILIYLVFSLSNYQTVRSHISPLNIPFDFLIPHLSGPSSQVGTELTLSRPLDFHNENELMESLNYPMIGKIVERASFRMETGWHHFKLQFPIKFDNENFESILIRKRDESPDLNNPSGTSVQIMLPKSKEKKKHINLGYAFAIIKAN